MWQISAADVDALVTGASLLGAGGGGPARLVATALRHCIAQRGPVDVVAGTELPSDGFFVPVGICGSGMMLEEKPMAGTELVRAVRGVAERAGVRVDAVACSAAAGAELLVAVLAAAQLRLPLVDADGSRRTVPRFDQTSITLAGGPMTPVALTGGTGGRLIIDGLDDSGAEQVIRAALPTFGGWACYAMRPFPTTALQRVMITDSVRVAYDLGRLSRPGDDEALARDYGVRTLFRGKVVEVRRQPASMPATGGAATAVIEHAEQAGRMLRVEMQSEYLLAIEDGELLACVPDLIVVLDHDSGECISTEQLRYGYWVRVLALPCVPLWRTVAGLALIGPRAFGYDLDYVPLEEASADPVRG